MLASFLACVDVIDTSLINLVLPKIHHCVDFPIDNILWILYVYLLCSSITTLILPFATKFISLYRILLFASYLYLFGTIAIYYMNNNFILVIIARCFQGIGVGVFNPSSLIIINHYFRDQQFVKVSSIYGVVILSIGSIVPLIYDVIVHFYNWNNMLFINILFILVILNLLAAIYSSAEQSNWSNSIPLMDRNYKLYKDKNFIIYLVISCCYFGISTSVVTFASFFIQWNMSLSIESVGILMFFKGLGGCISFISVPSILKKYKPNSLLSLSLIVTIFAYFLLYQYSFFSLYILSFFLQGFAIGIFNIIAVRCTLCYVPQSLNIFACSIYIFTKFIANLIFIKLFQGVITI
ncbi:MFS transporter [Candidatus Tisiphia endosymbiont of Temnostethus pusillus]|uniref:MFS transporter n=1 Tax=Candidatus Tisiphia endosymbiont of Temnostethus pusillus TaxID=3139335 RepID=UPI0035C8D395